MHSATYLCEELKKQCRTLPFESQCYRVNIGGQQREHSHRLRRLVHVVSRMCGRRRKGRCGISKDELTTRNSGTTNYSNRPQWGVDIPLYDLHSCYLEESVELLLFSGSIASGAVLLLSPNVAPLVSPRFILTGSIVNGPRLSIVGSTIAIMVTVGTPLVRRGEEAATAAETVGRLGDPTRKSEVW